MNNLLEIWATAMWRACWQGGLVILAVWLICRLLPAMPARFQCWLWRLAILKFIVALLAPWFLGVPLLPAKRVPEHVGESTMVVPADEVHREALGGAFSTPAPEQGPMSLPTPKPVSIMPMVLFFAWIIGVGWGLSGLLTAWRDMWRLVTQGRRIASAFLTEQLAIQSRLFSLRVMPRLMEVEGNGSPMLTGVFRPVILFPVGTLQRLSANEQKMVLGHELAHRRRGDLLWHVIAGLVRAVFFFHPFVWLAYWRLGMVQETAADELAIARQGHDPANYAELLVSVISKFGPARPLPQTILQTVGSVESLTARLVAMKFIGRASRRVVICTVVLSAAVVLLGVVPWRLIAAEPKPVDDNSAESERAHSQARFAGIVRSHVDTYPSDKPNADEAKAIAVIKKLGGTVGFGKTTPGRPVIYVRLRGSDADLDPLGGLGQLQRLDLSNASISDAGLNRFKGLKRLTCLDLSSTAVTDAGLEDLRALPQLEELDLTHTKVTDEGAKKLQQELPKCKIYFNHHPFSGKLLFPESTDWQQDPKPAR